MNLVALEPVHKSLIASTFYIRLNITIRALFVNIVFTKYCVYFPICVIRLWWSESIIMSVTPMRSGDGMKNITHPDFPALRGNHPSQEGDRMWRKVSSPGASRRVGPPDGTRTEKCGVPD